MIKEIRMSWQDWKLVAYEVWIHNNWDKLFYSSKISLSFDRQRNKMIISTHISFDLYGTLLFLVFLVINSELDAFNEAGVRA